MPFREILLRLLLLAAASLEPSLDARGQDGLDWPLRHAVRRNFTVEDGLPQNSVRAIAQTRDGSLWIATFGGLARYRGHGFEVFTDATTVELGSSFLLTLFEDRSGRLWIGSAEGHIACRSDGRFRGFAADQGSPQGEIRAFAELPDGTILAGGREGVAALRGDRFESLFPGVANAPRDVQHLYADSDGRVWCAAYNGLFVIHAGTCTRLRMDDGTEYMASFVARSPRVGLWARTSRGLVLVEGDTLILLTNRGADLPLDWKVYAALETPEGQFLFATGNSLLIARIQDGVATFLDYSRPRLPGSTLLLDREGNLWLGSNRDGISRLTPTPATELAFADLHLKRGNLLVAPASATDVWVASTEDRFVRRVSTTAPGLVPGAQVLETPTAVRGLHAAGSDRLWISDSAHVFLATGGLLEERAQGPWSNGSPMLQDASGALWIGGLNELVRIDEDQRVRLEAIPGSSPVENVMALAEGPPGTIWAGAGDRLLRITGGVVREEWTRADGLSGGVVRALRVRDDGMVWIGSYGGGLTRLEQGRCARIDATRGLFSDAISRIEEDAEGRFWINSNRGAFSVRVEDLDAVADGRADSVACRALHTQESGGIGGTRLDSGVLVFATIDGLAIVHPPDVPAVESAPVVELTEVVADGVAHDGRESVFVPPGPRELVFHFVGASITEPEGVRYRYRLLGFDADWRDGGAQATARYTNVPPGRYRFEVLARSYDGQWSREPAAVEVELEPRYFERTWFRVASVAFVALLVAFAFRSRARHAEARRKSLEEEVRQRTAAENLLRRLTGRLIHAQEDERRRVALELHDDLGQRLALLTMGLDVLEQRSQKAGGRGLGEEIAAISHSAKEISSDLHGISHRLHSTHLDKLGLRAALQSLARELSNHHELAITFQSTGEDLEPSSEVGLCFYRIAQEALRNAVRHSEAATVTMEFMSSNSEHRLVVQDDGRGISASMDRRHVGLGLESMRERALMVGGTLTIAEAGGGGTRIEVVVPCQRVDPNGLDSP